MQTVDLRSDTVTRPTPAMMDAMANAPLGDDVLGDEPSVQALEHALATLLNKDAACFVPSGTMANQTAIRAHTEPGDQIIAHADSHIYHYEGGAPAAISGCSFAFINTPRGIFDADDVAPLIRPDDVHFSRSRLLVVENTHNRGGGSVWPLEQIQRVTALARRHDMRCHLDGARLWNASVATGVTMAEYASHFDTVSCCFSKGLGAPVGSAVAGDADTIKKIRRIRKTLGGGMRQSGLLAAAAQYAMEHHVDRLAEDHTNAARLAEAVRATDGLDVIGSVDTNIVYIEVNDAPSFCERLEQRAIRLIPIGPTSARAVTHLDVSSHDIDRAIDAIRRPA